MTCIAMRPWCGVGGKLCIACAQQQPRRDTTVTVTEPPQVRGSLSLYGRSRWMRSSSVKDSEPCIEERCRTTADGSHVFAYAFDIEPGSLLDDVYESQRDSRMFLHYAIASFPDGTRLRITVEAVPNDGNQAHG